MKNIKEIKKGDIVTYTTGKVNYVNKTEKYIKYFDDNFYLKQFIKSKRVLELGGINDNKRS